MNQTSLVGRPLNALTRAMVSFAEKRGIWSGPLMSSSPELARLWAAPAISTGMNVNEETAFTYSVFWGCVNNISTDVGTLPLMLYKRIDERHKEPLRKHKLFRILHDFPNRKMTAARFRGALTSHALTWGTGYAEIVRDGQGQVAELWPITPDRVTPGRYTTPPYEEFYDVARANGGTDRLRPDQMFILPGSTHDGWMGRNIISMARESIGLGLAAERFGGTFFGNGASFGGVFEHPGRMSDGALKNFRDSVNSQHRGVEKAHKFIVVEENMKYQRLGVDPNAAQFLETRQHQVEEVCRWFRMPPHKVQHLIRTSYNSVEQLDTEYWNDTLRPWCVRWEQEILLQLIAPLEQSIQVAEHNLEGRLRGDLSARTAYYSASIQHGWMSPNDVRALENKNPVEGGDVYFFQVNQMPISSVQKWAEKQVEKTPAPVAPQSADDGGDEGAADERAQRVVNELRAQLETVQADLSEKVAQLQTTAASSLRFDQFEDLFAPHIATLSAQIAEGQKQEQALKLLLTEATKRAEKAEAEKEAQRIAAEVAAADARAAIEAVKQSATDEVHEAHAERDAAALEASKRVVQAQAERDAIRNEAAADVARLVREADEARQQTSAVDAEKARIAAENEALQAKVLEAEKRIQQAVSDQDALRAGIADAQAAVVTLTADLAESAKAQTDTSQRYQAENNARGLAEMQLAELNAVLRETQAERDRIAAERDVACRDAEAEAAKAAEAHKAMTDATRQLAKMTEDAAAASALLAEETARVAKEQAAHAETQRALEVVSEAARAAAMAAEAAKLAAEQATAESAAIRVTTDKTVADLATRTAKDSERVMEEQAAHEATRAKLKARADDEVARLQDEGEAERELLLRMVGKFVSKESEKVRRNGSSGAKLLAWADGHYLLAEETWVDDLRLIMRGHLARIRSKQDVDAYTRAIVHPHLETAAAQIRAVAKGDPEDFAVSLERLLTRWEQDRPAAIAAIIAKEEVNYVRSL